VFKNLYLKVDLPYDGLDYVVSESDIVLMFKRFYDRFWR